jgi:hypothetical protein
MIAVVMRQYDHIDRWQVSDLASGLDFAPGPDAMTQKDVLAFVQKAGSVRIVSPPKPSTWWRCR